MAANRSRMLAATGTKRDNFFKFIFCFLFFYLVSSFRINFVLDHGLGLGLLLVVM